MRPLALTLLLVLPTLAIAEPEYDCKRELSVWKNRSVDELIESFGEPTERKSKSNGRQIVKYRFDGSRPLPPEAPRYEEKALEPPPHKVAPGKVEPDDRPAASMTWSEGELERTESGVPGKGLPTAFVFFIDAEGRVTKWKCKY